MSWWLALVPVALVLADRLLLRAEARGWVYYRRRKPAGGGAAAVGPLFDIFQPTRTVQVQEQRSTQVRRRDVGDSDRREPTA